MQPFVYVKISTKLKHIRNHFFIKQYNFSKYGIHQHYISMIESEKRSPSREMISSIYDAIFKITNGEIINLYTKEQFSMTLEEQAINWLNTNFVLTNSKNIIFTVKFMVSTTNLQLIIPKYLIIKKHINST